MNRRSPRAGDIGTVVDTLRALGMADRFVVECLSPQGDGSTEWRCEFTEVIAQPDDQSVR